jgi:hypothetical protein
LAMHRGLGTRLSSILLLIGLILFGTRSHAEEVALAWDANRDSDLEGYGVYFKAGADGPPYDFFGYVGISDLPDADSPEFTVSGLKSNTTYHFAITAYDTAGNESAFSASVCAEVGAVVTPCEAGATPPASGTPGSSSTATASAASSGAGGSGSGCFIQALVWF